MATLQDRRSASWRLTTQTERLTMKVTKVTLDTGASNQDFFLSHVPESIWFEVAENLLNGLYREARR